YDHLSALINKILAERPENVVEYFEEYSRNFKEERFRPLTDHLQDIYVPPDEYENTKKTMSFLQKEAEEMAPEEEEATETPLPNLMELQYHFQQAGIGFPPSEMLLISLAMHKLKQNQPITKMRFWGKIFGLTKNYNVVETEEEGGGEPATEPEPEEKVEGEEEENKEEGAGDAKFVPKAKIPETTFKPPPVVPREASGEGVNKKVFFVCNEPGEEWTPLPDVTPQQIDIARISAGTQISPLGFYHFGEGDEEEEAEEEEAGEGKTEYVENPDFEPVPMQDLTDPSMSYWEEEAEEEEEETKEEAVEIETGPPLLTPLSEDASLETTPAWTVRQSTTLLPDTGVAIVRKFDNLYFGDGQKAVILNYSPPPLPPIENEYPLGPEIMEINDPTVEQEEEWRLAHEKKKPEPKGEEEEGGEEEEEEEGEGDEGDDEDEDDDDDE
ncbi:Radial spoke head protein 4 A, partial [Blattella germanica]